MFLPATLITFLPALLSTCAPGKRDLIIQTSMAQAAVLPVWPTGCCAGLCQQKSSLKTRAKVPRTLPPQRWWRWEGIYGRCSNRFFPGPVPVLGFKKLPFLWNPSARRVPALSTKCCLPWRAEFPKSTAVPSRYSKEEKGNSDLPDPPCRAESSARPRECALQGYSLFYSTFGCKPLN